MTLSSGAVSVTIADEHFVLLPQKAICWPATETLIMADLHLGKEAHFRKAGFAIPQGILKKDLERLEQTIDHYKPQRLMILGDLFHSDYNNDIQLFTEWRKRFNQLEVLLVKGNHDIIPDELFVSNNISCCQSIHIENQFGFVHDRKHIKNDGQYYFSGHIHPGVKISGKGRQSLRLPCFYISPVEAILPAYGNFTGLAMVKPKKHDQVFAIVEDKVLELQTA